LPATDPFAAAERPARARRAAPFAALRQPSLLSSPYLLAGNDVVACDPNLATCPPDVKSDANQSLPPNKMLAEIEESRTTIQDLQEGKNKIVGYTESDWQKVFSRAAEVALSDKYKHAFIANQLRDHPREVRHSAVLTGLGHIISGELRMGISAAMIYATRGEALALPLIGAMGLASGAAETASGFALAISGADNTATERMEGQLDYVLALTQSPTRLGMGTLGLVASKGDVGISYWLALASGFGEDMATLRGDPSKLSSVAIPGVGMKAEEGASALLMQNMAGPAPEALAESGASALLMQNMAGPAPKLYSAVVSGAGTKAKGGASELLIKNMVLPPEEVVQGMLSEYVARFERNPALVGAYLKEGEVGALTEAQAYAREGDWRYLELQAPTLFGKATERALVGVGQRTGFWGSIGQLRGPGGRFVSSPDLRGLVGPYRGLFFECTTNAALCAHLMKGYPPTTRYVTYDMPLTWYFFLTP
jgi:hypothetical protein